VCSPELPSGSGAPPPLAIAAADAPAAATEAAGAGGGTGALAEASAEGEPARGAVGPSEGPKPTVGRQDPCAFECQPVTDMQPLPTAPLAEARPGQRGRSAGSRLSKVWPEHQLSIWSCCECSFAKESFLVAEAADRMGMLL
jgi:hypothetical protein